MKSYAKCRRDFEFLETIAELEDQVELDAARKYLMENPTKEFAAGMYHSGICLWFKEHGVSPETQKIANDHQVTPYAYTKTAPE